jgi:hypothetical protein
MPYRFSLARLPLVLVIAGALLSGCTITDRLFRDQAAEQRAASILQLQLAIMRFADEYTARISEQVETFQEGTDDPAERLAAQAWLVSQATSAVTIAAGPNADLNAIDMLVFVTLSRMVIENRWQDELHGQRAAGLLATHQALERRIWENAADLLTEEQIIELRSSIEAWHAANPVGRAVPFIHLEDFAFATREFRPSNPGSGSIFAFLGIDPLRNLDPAVREIAQSRQLAERAVYYGQRLPKLISMEAQRLALAMAVTPESTEFLRSAGQLGMAAQATGDLVNSLPELLAAERAATIEQLAGILEARTGEFQALVVELRSALEAGGATSDSVRETVVSLDALVARFDRDGSPATGAPPRPFDVTEYTEALRQLSEAAQQLQALIGETDRKAPALARLSDHTAVRLAELVDHMYWRLLQLGLVLLAAGLIGALGYRAIVRRWG